MYRKGDVAVSDDGKGVVVEADASGVTIRWSDNAGGATYRYTWVEIEEDNITLYQR